mgnify:CR=1 FL=1
MMSEFAKQVEIITNTSNDLYELAYILRGRKTEGYASSDATYILPQVDVEIRDNGTVLIDFGQEFVKIYIDYIGNSGKDEDAFITVEEGPVQKEEWGEGCITYHYVVEKIYKFINLSMFKIRYVSGKLYLDVYR